MEETLQSGNLIKKLSVIGLCSLGASFSFFLLYKDIFQSGAVGTGKRMAQVEQLGSQVKRKASQSFLWSRVQKKDSLYEKESVQTGHDSYVSLKMKDGTTLEIGEDSLVILEDVKSVDLNFLSGNFILREKDQDLKIQVSKGTKKIEKLPIRLLAPMPNSEFYSFPKQSIEIEFSFEKNTASQKNMVLEVSEVKSFPEKNTKTYQIQGQSVRTKLSKGNYYWRMRSDEGLSEVRKVHVIEVTPIKLLSPINQTKVKQFKNIEGVEFQWSSESVSTDKSEHFLEISNTENFDKLLHQDLVPIEKGFYYLAKSLHDTIFWRIRSEYPGKRVLSEKSSFISELIENWEIQLTKPVAEEMVLNNRAVDFIWDFPNLLQEVSSQLILKNLNTNKVETWGTGQNRYRLENLDVGKYSWKVELHSKSKKIKESYERILHVLGGKNIQLLKPLKSQQFLYWKELPEITLEWGFNDSKIKPTIYEVELSETSQFQKILESKKSEAPMIKITSKSSGVLFWRVKAYHNKDFIGMSEVNSFQVLQYGKLKAPEVIFPNQNEILKILSPEDEPIFRWQKIENAEKYKIDILSKNKKIFSKVLVETSLKVKDLQDGEYSVSISAIDPLQREGQVSTQTSFKVDHGIKLAPPMKMKVEVE